MSLEVADATTGVVLVLAGCLMWRRRPGNRLGVLAVVAGALWFVGSLWPAAAFLHRGALMHVYFAYPGGHLIHRRDKVVVVSGHAVSIAPLVERDALIIVIWSAIAATQVVEYVRASGVARRARATAVVATIMLAAAVSVAATNRLLDWRMDRSMLWMYLLAVTGSTIALTLDFVRSNWSGAVVTNLVVDLGTDDRSDTLERAISGALGDPTLQIAYRLPGSERFVDDLGRVVDVSGAVTTHAITPILDGSDLMAYLVHDPAVLDDPALVAAVTECTRLTVSNARMQAATRERVVALDASRRRIVEAGYLQRRRFEEELDQSVERRLAAAADHMREARHRGSAALDAVLDDLGTELIGVRQDLADLTAGIHPRSLADGGLDAALTALAARVETPVEVRVAAGQLSPLVEATVYFVCAEALTNVVKHSGATTAQVLVEIDDHGVTASIRDDGVGGADVRRGSGLRGLADRVEAFGGRLHVESSRGRGTWVQASVPLDDREVEVQGALLPPRDLVAGGGGHLPR